MPIPNRPRKRDAAYIHVKAGDNSTISYMMPMIATSRGYEPTLNVHLDTVMVTSSLNDIRLINAESCVVSRLRALSLSFRLFTCNTGQVRIAVGIEME